MSSARSSTRPESDADAQAEWEAEREARAHPLTRLGGVLGTALTVAEARAQEHINERIVNNERARAAGERWCEYVRGVGITWHGPMSPDQLAAERLERVNRTTRRIREAGVPPLYVGANFDCSTAGAPLRSVRAGERVDGRLYEHGTERAIGLCRRLATDWRPGWSSKRGYNGLVLASPSFGCGKTHLVCAVLVALIQRGYKCRFLQAEQLLQQYRASFNRDSGEMSAQQIFEDLAACDVLALDELGGEYVKAVQDGESGGWARTQFLRLIEHRYQRGLPTLATTNLSKEAMGRHYEGRMQSRLLSRSVYVPMDGPDFRSHAATDDVDPFEGEDPFADD